jgi:hypothetical protein
MSTWRIEDVKEVEEAKELEDSGAGESCLARKVESFGMAVGGHYTPRRI